MQKPIEPIRPEEPTYSKFIQKTYCLVNAQYEEMCLEEFNERLKEEMLKDFSEEEINSGSINVDLEFTVEECMGDHDIVVNASVSIRRDMPELEIAESQVDFTLRYKKYLDELNEHTVASAKYSKYIASLGKIRSSLDVESIRKEYEELNLTPEQFDALLLKLGVK